MKLLLFAVVALCVYSSKADEEIPKDEGVLVLGKNNFETATKAHNYLLVEFCKYLHKVCPSKKNLNNIQLELLSRKVVGNFLVYTLEKVL